MRVLRAEQDLRQLLGYLSRPAHHSTKLPITGVIQNTLRGKIAFEAVVDDWPEYSAIVVRPVPGITLNKYFEKTRFVYGEDAYKVGQLLRTPGIFPWNTGFSIKSLPTTLVETVREVARERDCNLSYDAEYKTVKGIGPTDENYNLPKGYYFDKLKMKHAPLVAEHWKFTTGKETVDRISYQIDNFFSDAVYNDKDEPVTWSLHQFDGSTGMSATLPEYRRKGLATAQWKHEINTFAKTGLLLFGLTDVTNTASLAVNDKITSYNSVPGIVVSARIDPYTKHTSNSKL